MVHFVNLIPALATLKRRERGSPSLFVACYWVDQRRDHGDDTFSKSFPLSPQVAPRCPGKSLLHSLCLNMGRGIRRDSFAVGSKCCRLSGSWAIFTDLSWTRTHL